MPLKIFAKGPKVSIYKWAPTEGSLQDIFFDCPKATEADNTRTINTIRLICETGYPKNPEKFKHVQDELYEIKATNQLRIIGIKAKVKKDSAFVAFLCIRKKKDRLKKQDIKRAEDFLALYKEEMKDE